MTKMNLPSNWMGLVLEDVAEIHDNLREPVNRTERATRLGPYPYFGATGQVGWIDDYRQDGEYVLLGEDGAPFFDSTKEKAYLVTGKCWVNNHAHVLKGRDGLCSNRYLLYALNQTNYRGYANGTTRLKLTQSAMRQLPINLAPLPEQHRIVAKIEALFSELDKGIESFKAAREQLKIYRQALLKHAFSGKLTEQWRAEIRDNIPLRDVIPTEDLLQRIQTERGQRYQQQLKDWEANGKQGCKPKAPKTLPPLTAEELAELPELPSGWAWFLMGDICFESILGKMLDKKKNKGELKPYLRNINVRWGKFTFENLLEMRFEESEFARYGLEDGDLVICEGGEPGRCAVWRKEFGQNMQIQKALHRIRFTQSINATFVQMYFEFCTSNHKLEKMFTGTTIKHLTGEKLARMTVPICSINEQNQILFELESKFSEIDQLDQTLSTALQQAETLRQAILKKAFSGQLVLQDPSDEPAGELLKRIQAEKAAMLAQTKTLKKR